MALRVLSLPKLVESKCPKRAISVLFVSRFFIAFRVWLRGGGSEGIDLKLRPAKIALADHGDGKRPGNSECCIVVAIAACGLRRIKRRDLVDDLTILSQGLKAMRYALRDIDW